jgi:hypothetical protein
MEIFFQQHSEAGRDTITRLQNDRLSSHSLVRVVMEGINEVFAYQKKGKAVQCIARNRHRRCVGLAANDGSTSDNLCRQFLRDQFDGGFDGCNGQFRSGQPFI